jgi:acetyl esterase/lipase
MSRPSLTIGLTLFMPVSLLAAIDLPMPVVPDVPLTVEKGVTYATVGGKDLKLDIAVPKTGGPFPAVVCFHGGGWKFGSRSDLSSPTSGKGGKPGSSVIEAIASRGYAAASVSYRLMPANKFPAQIEDAKAAVRFLRASAKTFNLDPDRVGALGFSAGGHLAMLLGTTDSSAGFDVGANLDKSGRVQAVVSFFGPTDLALYAATPGIEDAFMVPFLGAKCKTDPAVYRRASPIDHVTKDSAPVLMIHGTADFVVPIIHSERMLKKLRDAGVTAELLTVPGGGHGWGGERSVRTLDAAVKFLDAHLKGKK